MKPLVALTLTLAVACPAMAGFAKPTQSVKLRYGQQETILVFEADSAITKAKPHCDCTTVSVSGNKLTAVVDTSAFDASVDKTISATTADGKTTTLTMKFDVPQAVIFSPAALIWKVGEAPTPKVLRITVPAGSPVKALKQAGLEGEDFIYDAAKGKRKGEYTVTVTPKSTAKRLRNRLVIKMESADPRFSQRIILLRVNK
ncbi:MAG: hypothetical protein IJB64_02855 [Akkermansia sp.]|nr:hypothetical protein [Akkermansia sp.]